MNSSERSQYLISRPRVPIDAAARFVETRIVASGESDAVYSERGGNFVTVQQGEREEQISIDMWKQADAEKEELFRLIEQVQNKFDDKGGNILSGQELRRCKWDQVMAQVQETSSRWKSSPQRMSRAMQYIDKLGSNSEAFKSWLELLPAGDYGASIAGVFTLVIGAAGRYKKVEDEIFQALSEIPEILEHSRRYIKIYADLRDNFLEKRTFDLFRSILRTLSHIMRFFKDSALRKFSESILKQGSYKEELTMSLEEVTKCSEKLQEEANQCLAWRLYRQDRMLQQTDQKADQGLNLLQSIYRLLLASPILGVNTKAHSADGNAQEHIPAYQTVATIADSLSGQTFEPRGSALDQLRTGKGSKGKRASSGEPAQKARKLLRLLRYDPNITFPDVDNCLKLGEAFDEGKKARAAAMITNSRFEEFMAEYLASSSLLINGREDVSSTDGISSLSYVTAKLARISEKMESPLGSPYVIKYFCNQHRPFFDDSGIPSPVTMMVSLVGQLLAQMIEKGLDVNLSMLTERDWQRVEKSNLKLLCNIFRELVDQLPPGSVVLCIIDDLAQYEIEPFMDDTNTIIRRLTRLVAGQDQTVFKLLVTCQGRALEISKYFISQTVDLTAEIEPEDSDSWKISAMDV
ncbi:hypothetical protein F4680DRAFT_365004 [Xylaria scruposa]|nr:hypothetical protein F4680DRAFT_365004 [Xylaria scruposa]